MPPLSQLSVILDSRSLRSRKYESPPYRRFLGNEETAKSSDTTIRFLDEWRQAALSISKREFKLVTNLSSETILKPVFSNPYEMYLRRSWRHFFDKTPSSFRNLGRRSVCPSIFLPARNEKGGVIRGTKGSASFAIIRGARLIDTRVRKRGLAYTPVSRCAARVRCPSRRQLASEVNIPL